MKPDDPTASEALRQALRAGLQQAPAADSEALQARVLAQWRQRHAHLQTEAEPVVAGGPGHLHLPRKAWGWGMLGMAVISAALAYGLAYRTDSALEELLQPDVLSQIGLGEL